MTPPRRRLAVILLPLLAFGCAQAEAEPEEVAPGGSEPSSLEARAARAERLASKGDLIGAVHQWRILELLDGDKATYREKRRALEVERDRRVEAALERGRAALAKRRAKDAKAAFLEVLAYDGLNEEARAGMQSMEAAQVRLNRPRIAYAQPPTAARPAPAVTASERPAPPATPAAAGKKKANARQSAAAALDIIDGAQYQESPLDAGSDAERGTQIAARTTDTDRAMETARAESLETAIDLAKSGNHLAAIPRLKAHLQRFPKDGTAQDLLAESHREIGIAYYQDGKLRESVSHLRASADYAKVADPLTEAALNDASVKLAQQAYEEGVKVFNSDIGQAIDYWEESLEYDPSHLRARSYLDKAYKIQDTLSDISADN